MYYQKLSALLVASTAALVSAQGNAATSNIYVAATNGLVHKAKYDPTGNGSLSLVSKTDLCGEKPSWLFKILNQTSLWCVNEGITGGGSIARLNVGLNDSFNLGAGWAVPGHPVHAAPALGFDHPGVAIYSDVSGEPGTGGGSWVLNATNGELTTGLVLPFPPPIRPSTMPGQDVSHPHMIIPDPTGKHAVIPDLGTDSLRIWSQGENLNEVLMERGTGPRHGAFFAHQNDGQWFFFVVGELSNTVTTFNVSYTPEGALQLNGPSRVISVFQGTQYEGNEELIANARAAELKISPDNKFLSVSVRKAKSAVTGPGMKDAIVSFAINPDGSLNPRDYAETGLANPRAFEFSPAGDKILVSFYDSDSSIAVYDRDTINGGIDRSGAVASLYIDTRVNEASPAVGINHAIWDY